MTTLPRLVGIALLVALAAGPAAAQPKKNGPIGEADLLTLVGTGIGQQSIIDRINEVGVGFAAEDTILQRLKKAGASDALLAAVKKKAKPAAAIAMGLMVERNFSSWDNPLHSELTINDKSLGTFSASSDRDVGEYLKPGWNTIALTTKTPGPTDKENDLKFRIGPVAKKDGRPTMTPLWEFRNGTDWKYADGKYTHQTGPDVKQVVLTYKVYFAGLAAEGRPVAAGDYVLNGEPHFSSWNAPVTATVFVNNEPVNTFLGRERPVVITPYLRKGKNVFKVVTHRVKDAIADNDIKFKVVGPAEYNVNRGRFEFGRGLQFAALTGWKKHEKTGQLVNLEKEDAESFEKEYELFLDREPGKR